MDEFKFKPLEDWLKEARKGDCGDFIAMAVNKEHQMCSTVSCSYETMAEMLLTACNQNKGFRGCLLAVSAVVAAKVEKEEKADKPKFKARRGGVR